MAVMESKAGPRERLVRAAIALVQEKGVEGTGLTELLARGDVARRSLYQHFPGGKDELIAASTRQVGEVTAVVIRELVGQVDAATLFELMLATIRQGVVDSDFRYSCPIAAAAYAPADSDRVRDAAGAAFADWRGAIADVLVEEGRPADAARGLAGFMVATVEGALVVARATRSTEPLDQAAVYLAELLRA